MIQNIGCQETRCQEIKSVIGYGTIIVRMATLILTSIFATRVLSGTHSYLTFLQLFFLVVSLHYYGLTIFS